MDKAGLDDLLRRAAGGEADALGELVEGYSPRVFGLLYRLTGSRDAAEDLMQETFLRVVRMIAHYEHADRFESWLFRIAANLARDRARRRSRRGEMSTLDAAAAAGRAPGWHVVSGDDPAEHALRREAGERLEAGLQRLSDAEREIILLRHYAALPFREIAKLLSIPLGTALARAHRALRRLGDELAADEMRE